MPKFYFTYGSSETFPYQDGWTEVYAENMGQAQALFRAVHPDNKPGIINCSWIYTEEKFREGNIFKDGHNFGQGCHEVIGCFNSPKNILISTMKYVLDYKTKDELPVGLGQFFGAVDMTHFLGMIFDEEVKRYQDEIIARLKLRFPIPSSCCFCGKEIPNVKDRHNAAPLKDGNCCAVCNAALVIPARKEQCQ